MQKQMNGGLLESIGTGVGQSLLPTLQQTQADVTQQVQDVKSAAETYAGITIFLQVISTGAICLLAYVAWQDHQKKHAKNR